MPQAAVSAHICNTFFEKELERPSTRFLHNWLNRHPITCQLQFLPLLYAAPDDIILVTALPPNPDPRLHLLSNPPPISRLHDWGASPAIAAWSQEHNILYEAPNLALLQEINSKVFSFTHSPKLPNAATLHSHNDLQNYLASTPTPIVLKTPFGSAGNGHIHLTSADLTNVKQLYIWPVIAEPWVQRVQDFSTQWHDGKLLGFTCFENEANGTYKRTFAGSVESWAMQEHLRHAQPLVEKIAQMGYKGHLGIDAFLYRWQHEIRLHPIVEINCRKTMSWVSLVTKQPISYAKTNTGLLPSALHKHIFSRNIQHI